MQKLSRRNLLSLTAGISAVLPNSVYAAEAKAPVITHGCSVGEVTANSAILWCRANRSSQVQAELAETVTFTDAITITGNRGNEANDFNCKVYLRALTPDTTYYFRLTCVDPVDSSLRSNAEVGRFTTAQLASADVNTAKDIRFCWSGDTCGQGYGIDVQQGGMLTYKTLLERQPDFFVHVGDQIYADGPLQSERQRPEGGVWKNLLTAGKAKVAETTQEFRENFYYNFLDEHVKRLHRQIPVYHMWDDHEVVNNWYPGERLDDDRYTEKRVSVLAANARQAFLDCLPVNSQDGVEQKLFRYVSRGPLLDLFFVDLRSYRGPNSENRQLTQSAETEFWGREQLDWLKQQLLTAPGVWKIICIDMPISVMVTEWGTNVAENAANGDGPALGRELEYAELFEFIAEQDIKNVHFVTADVHYCASYRCDPARAQFKHFKPFWEFISGPLHAGTFGPNPMDNTFGPAAEFIGVPDNSPAAASPAAGLQFFGEMDISADTQVLTVRHINRAGDILWERQLQPEN